ncbi:E3 ubiquitin-protein ligase LRSAM1-like isoform X2 [Cylas formicarius]|uniref:E3 ubiquitin-protein ligase LRSAM1-like isoform X2 n=1 Tax=Cylas formicarius TaxID=197179 RepID=UPI0029588F50|nr:E3 ubiquitin-protein ligase LRSAM1-like isoform X2 [Cylas formicarius]
MFRRKKPVDKKKLEHKLYLARETPESVFDLSECNLHQVPGGIYSLCKVFLKQSLTLHNNQLSSLTGGGSLRDLHNLTVLDISTNLFRTIPEEISALTNLTELHAHDNQLRTLPDGLCRLVYLKMLDVSSNLLKSLPEDIGELQNLRKLNVAHNKYLRTLPGSICKIPQLVCLELDPANFSYPPSEIAHRGIEEIMKYICEDTCHTYQAPQDLTEEGSPQGQQDITDSYESRRALEFLEIERNNEFAQRREFEVAMANKADRDKLLTRIAEQQSELDDRLGRIRQDREVDRFRLIEQLQEAENNADVAIGKLLGLSGEPQRHLLEREKEEEERLLAAVTKYNAALRKDDILSAMGDLVRREAETFEKFDRDRVEASTTILEQVLDQDSRLADILERRDEHRSELVSELIRANAVQRAAFGALLEKGDARSWALAQQVRLVETQLATLTVIELDRRRLKMDEHLNDLAEKRVGLSALLVDLLERQRERRGELLRTLRRLDAQNENRTEDFWLRQYQRLLDGLPEGLARAQADIDPRLSECLLMEGALHCVPLLAKIVRGRGDLRDVTDGDLIDAGVANDNDRSKVLDALHAYSVAAAMKDLRPTAPLPDAGPSAPPVDVVEAISSVECVVCMELQCHVTFVPCGHLCCCAGCSVPLALCPLCRTAIERKISTAPSAPL